MDHGEHRLERTNVDVYLRDPPPAGVCTCSSVSRLGGFAAAGAEILAGLASLSCIRLRLGSVLALQDGANASK